MIIDLTGERRSRRPAITLQQMLDQAEAEVLMLAADADRSLFVESAAVEKRIWPILHALRTARDFATDSSERRPG